MIELAMDRLTGLSVFVTAVEQGSLAAAARRLGMTPAMAGKHIASMEASLGVRLLYRTTRKLHLTAVGEDYLQRARQILDALDEADGTARELQTEPRGILRIAAPTTFGTLHLGPPIADFLKSYPSVRIEMSLSDRFVDLVAEGIDLAIRIGTLSDSSLIARRFAQSDMLACATPNYLDQNGRPGTPSDLAKLDRLAFSQATSAGDWRFTDRDGRNHSVSGPTRLSADTMDILLSAALAGAGVVYGPAFVLSDHVNSGALERILPDYTTESLGIHAVYPSGRLVSAKVRHFITLLHDRFAERAAWTITGREAR